MRKKIGVFLIFISLFMVGLGLYKMYFNPKNVMMGVMAKQISLFKDSNIVNAKKKITTKGSINTNALNLNFDGDTYVDTLSNKFYLKLNSKTNGKDFLSPEVFYNNDKLYFKIKEISDKMNYVDLELINNDTKITNDELNLFINKIGTISSEYLSNDSFDVEKKEVFINKNSIKTNKYTLTLTALDIYEISTKILTEVKNNSKLSTIKSILFSALNEETYLSDMKKNIIGNRNEKRIILKYSIYLEKIKTPVKSELVLYENNSQEINDKFSVSYYDMGNKKKNYEVIVQSDNKNIYEFVLDIDDLSSNIKMTLGNIYAEGTLDSKDKKANVNFFNIEDKTIPIATLNYQYIESNDSKKSSDKLEFQSKIGGKLGKFDFVIENQYLDNQEVPGIDVSKAIKFDFKIFDQLTFNS